MCQHWPRPGSFYGFLEGRLLNIVKPYGYIIIDLAETRYRGRLDPNGLGLRRVCSAVVLYESTSVTF